MAQTEFLKNLAIATSFLIPPQKPPKRFGKIFCRNAHTELTAKRLARAYSAAQEDLKTLALDSVNRCNGALQSDVAYVMLAAGVRTAGHTDSDRLFKRDFSR